MIPFMSLGGSTEDWRSPARGSNDGIFDPENLDPSCTIGANAAMMIYKVLRPAEWAKLQADGKTAGAPVDLADGFVHFSTAGQLARTLSKHFAAEGDLVMLACDVTRLGGDLRWEPSRGGDLFPHLYRALAMADIAWARDIRHDGTSHQTGPLE